MKRGTNNERIPPSKAPPANESRPGSATRERSSSAKSPASKARIRPCSFAYLPAGKVSSSRQIPSSR
eukprot:549487-Hanusia_phi.AAC.5